jgi:hormone-sensitive lipase
LEAYLWTIYYFKQVYEVNPKRIVLVGDSAGGNLVAALTNLLIEWNLPLPTGLVLVYPALNLNVSNYTPSLLTALNDMILPHTFLKICAQSYLKDYQNETNQNHFISPIFACDDTLSKYPQT